MYRRKSFSTVTAAEQSCYYNELCGNFQLPHERNVFSSPRVSAVQRGMVQNEMVRKSRQTSSSRLAPAFEKV